MHARIGSSTTPLGHYTLGAEIAQIPSGDLIVPINRVVFPGYARIANDGARLRETFLDVLGVIVLCALPAAFGIAAVADPLVRVALGDQWLDTIPVIQILAVAVGIGAATSHSGAAYLALGKPHWLTVLAALRLLLIPPLAIVLVLRLGMVGAAYTELLVSAATFVVSVPLLLSRLRLSWASYCARLWRPLLASAAMWYAVDWTIRELPLDTFANTATASVAGIAVGVACYVAVIGLLWAAAQFPRGAERALLEWVHGRLHRAA